MSVITIINIIGNSSRQKVAGDSNLTGRPPPPRSGNDIPPPPLETIDCNIQCDRANQRYKLDSKKNGGLMPCK